MSIIVTYHEHGTIEDLEFHEVNQEDEQWFKDNNAKLSAERNPTGVGFILYCDVGIRVEGEPIEAIEITGHKDCRKSLAALRVTAEGLLK